MTKRSKPKGDPIDAIAAHMAANGLGKGDLDVLIGKTAASLLLNRRRPLSLAQIRVIHAAWGIDANDLIGECRLVNPAK
jgi:antitoxin component HigA of HigAB toxin-antitoxin module